MKPYLVFAGDYYYPGGGWSDFYGQYDTYEQCEKVVATELFRSSNEWWEIVDLRTCELINSGKCK